MKSFAVLICLCSNFAAAGTPWERYLDAPTSANASNVDEIAYSTPKEFAYDSDELEILKLQVLAADPTAFTLAFRLYQKSDGGLAEELAAILASVIRPNPVFFLRQVAQLNQPCSKFNLGVPGLEYVDRLEAQAYELRMRRNSIAGVADTGLDHVRAECMALLPATD